MKVIDVDDPGGKLKVRPRNRSFVFLVACVLLTVLVVSLARSDSGTPILSREAIEEAARVAMQTRLTQLNPDGIPTGYVRVPKLPAGPHTEDDRKLHIIFSSGCNYFQHWQSELVLASALFVGQRGRITRIVSGCHDKSAEHVKHEYQTFPGGQNDLLVPVEALNRSVNDNFGLFITSSFDGAKNFPWLNKPLSIRQFMETARPELDRLGEEVIVILDPDFVFLRAITTLPLPLSELLMSPPGKDGLPPGHGVNVVSRGVAVAQQYGLGGGWVDRFNVSSIAGADSPATTYTHEQAAKFFSVGPPLMLHVDDLAALAPLWARFMRDVLRVAEGDILADMWAYCIAAAHLRLHHRTLDQFMISTWEGNEGQAFRWVDAWKHLRCLKPERPLGHRSPNFVHLASNFKAPEAQDWMFHKGHVPAKILDCNSPLLVESPDDLWEKSHDVEIKRQAWVLCHTVSTLNRMLLVYKEKFCPKPYESRKLVRLIQEKTRDQDCNEMQGKWCYPLAQIEGLRDDWRTNGPDKE